MARSRFSPETVAIWRWFHAGGVSYPAIGRLFGCHHTTVLYHVDGDYRERKERQRKAALR